MPIVTRKPSVVTPAPPSNPVAMQTTAQTAREAALKMLETHKIDDSQAPIELGDKDKKLSAKPADNQEPEDQPSEEVRESEQSESAEPADPPVSDEPEEEKAPAKEPAEKEVKKEGLPDPLRNSFEKLAQEKAAFRKEQADQKAENAKLEKYKMLDNAVKNRDVLGAIAALGFSYKDVVAQVTSGKAPPETESDEEPTQSGNPMEERIARLEETLSKERFARNMEQLQTKMTKLVDPKKHPNIHADPELIADAHRELVEFTRRTGSPPGSNIEESILMALEAIEQREEAAAAKYLKRKGLTAAKPAGSIPAAEPKSAVEPPASELGKQSRTLTNSHASNPQGAGSTKAKTVEELRAEAAKLLVDQA